MYNRDTIPLVIALVLICLSLLSGCATTFLSHAMWSSIREGDIDRVEKLIGKGADLNARFYMSHETALTLAVQGESLQMVTMLVEGGAEIDAMNGNYYTPLMIAAESGNAAMAKLLIQSGANVNMSNDWDNVERIVPNTALMAASWHGQSEMVQLLIDAGADVHYRDSEGLTALEFAIRWRRGEDSRKTLETVIVLVQAGADGSRALGLIRSEISYQRDLVDELAKILHEAGAVDPHRLAISGYYFQIAEYLEKWIDGRYD